MADRYDNISDSERRKLLKDLSRAAREIGETPPPELEEAAEGPVPPAAGEEGKEGQPGSGGGRVPAEASGAEAGEEKERSFLESRYRLRRPSYWTRIRIDSYAYARGFEICGFKQLLNSLFSFLNPRKDTINSRFARALILDHPYKEDPSGYSLSRTILEIKQLADFLLSGGSFLKRATDELQKLKLNLSRDLLNFEPFGYKLLKVYAQLQPELSDALKFIKVLYDHGRGIDTMDLTEVVRGVYRLNLRTDASFEVVKERIGAVGDLTTSLYRRIYSDEQKIKQVNRRIATAILEFYGCYYRLKWYAHQLYPALLKMLNRFQEEQEAYQIAESIYRFVDLDRMEVLRPEALPPKRETPPPAPEPEAIEPAEPELKDEFKGILTILDYAFPGAQIDRIGEGDNIPLFWFHQKLLMGSEPVRSLHHRRSELYDLLWKISADDPLGPVILLYEIIGQMLEALDPEALSNLTNILALPTIAIRKQLTDIKQQWPLIKERLIRRYLQEIDYFEKEAALSLDDRPRRFLDTAAGRKMMEIINQIRNHLIRDYGQVALAMNRNEYFKCRPLYGLTAKLLKLLDQVVIERSLISEQNPLVIKQLEESNIVHSLESPVIKQVKSYIESIPRERWLVNKPRAEFQRQFLEILHGTVDLLDFLINKSFRLKAYGGEIRFAGSQEKEIRNRIAKDKTPLRVELKRDFQDIDKLTGLLSKNEYIKIMPRLFKEVREKGQELTLLLFDLDHFKAVNDAKGHDFGDEILKSLSSVIRSSVREEDLAVRFGGEEMLVILRGDYRAGAGLAERICKRFGKLLFEKYARAFEEIPVIMADKEYRDEKNRNPDFQGRAEEVLTKWKSTLIGTLSAGVAQVLGGEANACADEREAFVRVDKMLYLAKESGRNRVVIMVNELKIPLVHFEYLDFLGFLERESGADPREFAGVCSAENNPLYFENYSYAEYLKME